VEFPHEMTINMQI